MPNFDYTSRDYNSIRSSLIARATQSIPEWSSTDPSDFMNTLVDLWAYSADVMHYYIDRASTEAFLGTATQRESVMALANLYGYTPNYMRSATATLSVTNTGASTVSLPAYTSFTTAGGVQFVTESAYSISANSTSSIAVRQGTLVSNEAVTSTADATRTTSNGTSNQRFNIYRQNVDPTSVRVFVTEGTFGSAVEWTRVTNLVQYGPNDTVFTMAVTSSGTAQIVFGNGVSGKIPQVNAGITTTYLQTQGSGGNVAAGSITSLMSSLYPTLTTITNPVAAGGGVDYETIDSIKRAIPSVARTRNGAVSLSDFADLALLTAGVSKAVASYGGSASAGASVTVTVVGPQDSYLTTAASVISVETALKDRVTRDLTNQAMLGVALVNVPSTVTLTKIYIYLDLYVKSNYVQVNVRDAVFAAIQNLFTFDNVSFGQVLTIGEVYRIAMAVPGVDYLVIKGFTTDSTSSGFTTIDTSGKITIASNRLPQLGLTAAADVVKNIYGGVSAV